MWRFFFLYIRQFEYKNVDSQDALMETIRASKRGEGSVGVSVRGPENQEGACESLKGNIPIALY
jgi:hypothetical protein